MNRTLANQVSTHVGERVVVKGWVQSRRDHGGLIFIDLRDHTGLTQLVVNPEKSAAFAVAEQARDEYVLSVKGSVKERDESLKNSNVVSGDVEIVVDELTVLNKAEALPIQPFAEAQANEEHRLKYRYLDLRRPKMQQMLKKRAEFLHYMRSFMMKQEFTDVATPILANSSPEGARDFLIPSRLHEGKFYALPQAPQQFKQLLMVGGLERYFQIAACFRDEDPRADRLFGEFYQLDMEMSFVESGQEVRDLMQPLICDLVTDFAGKSIAGGEVVTISHHDAMETYGSDKPDLRYDMRLVDLTETFRDTEFGVFKSAERVKAICVKDGASLSRKQIDDFTTIAKQEGAGGLAYIMYENGEAKSPIAKFMSATELSDVQKLLGAQDGDAIFFGADTTDTVNKVLGKLRISFADHFELKDPNVISLVWVVDFPFYEWDAGSKKVDFGHNPFTMPKGGLDALLQAATDAEKLAIVADQYDMAMNGYEICSGGVRNHNPDVLYKAFGLLGYDEAYVDEKFGAMINAFKFGAPPHAGCAFGIDRMFMELMGESNIREVVAFPKNGSGVDVMMSSPSTVDQSQLKELGIS
jgi:aspartyl-tRNA synthetase